MGFCVATTTNGSGRALPSPSIETWPSSIASSSAACVLGGVRLTSSASNRFVNTGPWRKENEPPVASKIVWPITSDGMRSGVNWMRRNSRSRAAATALTTSVFATPGTPSSRTWPRTSSAATKPESVPSWPTTTFPTSSRNARIGPRGSNWSAADSIEGLPADAVELVCKVGERGLVEHWRVAQCPCHAVVIEAGAGRDETRHGLRVGARWHAETFTERSSRVETQGRGGGVGGVTALLETTDGSDELRTRDGHRLRFGDRTADAS